MVEQLISDFDFELPQELIAQAPPRDRDGGRLLLLGRDDGAVTHARIAALADAVRGDELFVFNDTRVVPARLMLDKDTGGRVEVLALHPLDDPRTFVAMARSSKRLRPGAALVRDGRPLLRVEAALGEGRYALRLPDDAADLWSLLDACGEIPLPPYIGRPEGPSDADADRYQTVFAREPGAVAAPTAGLHFTDALLARLADRGCEVARVTLHVGPGTFLPVRVERLADHRMHAERYRISEEAAHAINAARDAGRPVVAVGTTVVRTLEASAASTPSGRGRVAAGEAETDLFIRPGAPFAVVDQLLTNFHLPGSTLLVLVSAFAGRERVLAAYREAIAERYRFFSYGDAMWIR